MDCLSSPSIQHASPVQDGGPSVLLVVALQLTTVDDSHRFEIIGGMCVKIVGESVK